MELVDKDVKTVWNEAKEKSDQKVNWNILKHVGKDVIKEGTFKGVLVGDKELDNLEKDIVDTEKNENSKKAVVYAGININKKEDFPPLSSS